MRGRGEHLSSPQISGDRHAPYQRTYGVCALSRYKTAIVSYLCLSLLSGHGISSCAASGRAYRAAARARISHSNISTGRRLTRAAHIAVRRKYLFAQNKRGGQTSNAGKKHGTSTSRKNDAEHRSSEQAWAASGMRGHQHVRGKRIGQTDNHRENRTCAGLRKRMAYQERAGRDRDIRT